MTRSTIAQDIRDVAAAYDQSGRTTQPIKVLAALSTIEKAIRSSATGFSAGEGGGFFYGLHPIVCLDKDTRPHVPHKVAGA